MNAWRAGPRRLVICASNGAATIAALVLLGACAMPGPTPMQEARAQMEQATAGRAPVVVPTQISDALQAPPAPETPAEPRFDLIVNSAQAREVFLAMVADTRYSMLMHPEVTGTLSVTLRGVTVREALEAIRDVYGYDFKIDGRRITVYPPTLQTRIFTVNYLNVKREGRSEIRVNSGASSLPGTGGSLALPAAVPGAAQPQQAFENSHLSTTSSTDFWTELGASLRGIVGSGAGRNVVVSPQSGVVAVRAMPDELRQVEAFLKATRISVERQVILEAKIVEVQLREGFQSGVDWSVLRGRGAAGTISGSAANQLVNPPVGPNPPSSPTGTSLLPNNLLAPLLDTVEFPARGSGLFGLVFGTRNFEGVLSFLETQGNTQILSSPRVAALNNQKAVLKVGTDEFFVTNVSTVTTTTGTTSQQTPTVTVAPFFSGILLDVTPRIDENDNIMLHIHPSISEVTESQRVVNLGGTVPSITLPLARSTVSETDSIVRASNGNIVAIGGLMSVDARDNRGGVPGLDAPFLRNTDRQSIKRELVILLKPTVLTDDRPIEQDIRDTEERLRNLYQDGRR